MPKFNEASEAKFINSHLKSNKHKSENYFFYFNFERRKRSKNLTIVKKMSGRKKQRTDGDRNASNWNFYFFEIRVYPV